MAMTRTRKACSFCGERGGPATDVPPSAASAPRTMGDAEMLATVPMILASAEQNTAFARKRDDAAIE